MQEPFVITKTQELTKFLSANATEAGVSISIQEHTPETKHRGLAFVDITTEECRALIDHLQSCLTIK